MCPYLGFPDFSKNKPIRLSHFGCRRGSTDFDDFHLKFRSILYSVTESISAPPTRHGLSSRFLRRYRTLSRAPASWPPMKRSNFVWRFSFPSGRTTKNGSAGSERRRSSKGYSLSVSPKSRLVLLNHFLKTIFANIFI